MSPLHSNKIASEKDAFIAELLSKLPTESDLKAGTLASKARRLHAAFLPLHIVKYYTPETKELRSPYFPVLMSHAIEAECLLILGFRNSGISALRSTLEAALKLLYYETHPIECILHERRSHALSNAGYRDFAYSFPGLTALPFLERASLEKLWSHLCRFVHSDLRTVSVMSTVADISPLVSARENEFTATVETIRAVIKTSLAILLAIDPQWLKEVEKIYFDAVLDAFTSEERKIVREALRIA